MKRTHTRIGVLTSGGDAPGMNACIRAVVRTAIYQNLEPYGIKRGYEGLIDDEIELMPTQSVGNIIHQGGTLLKTARSKRFMTAEGRQQAYENLKKHEITALIVIGGDGTFTGARLFCEEHPDIAVMGVPATIDNDIYGSDYTIGFDSAINTAMRAIDQIRDTADSHNRLFFVEVMGRASGMIALHSGIGGGASGILVPELKSDYEEVIALLDSGQKRKKYFSIVVVAEGEEQGGAFEVARKVTERVGDFYDIKVTVLGHVQRGGAPSCADRVLASRLGMAAVDGLLQGESAVMVGVQHDQLVYTALDLALRNGTGLNRSLLRLAQILAL
jgi:6-phosphofructokinase 1